MIPGHWLTTIAAAAVLTALGVSPAAAEDETPTPEPAADEGSTPEPAAGEPLELVGTEVIEVWDERPDKPFDRDTELRLTGEEIAEQGATNLAEAIELLPDIHVRAAGRGGRQIDIRGSRKGSIKILVDGISVDDPYYGNFDLESIPVTDIVQIRVSSSPSSPIDGAGGPGGVIEVHTRDAYGPRLVEARLRGDTLPTAEAAATGRSRLGERFAMRVSAAGILGARDFDMPTQEVDEQRRGANGALRLEYRDGDRRVALDAWGGYRTFVVPPDEIEGGDVLVIDGENTGRVGLAYDDRAGAWRLRGSAYGHVIARESTYYSDATLSEASRNEELTAYRTGATFLANRPFARDFQVIASAVVDTEAADVVGFDDMNVGGHATVAELAAGLQYQRGPIDIDAAIGAALPIALDGADPWPEGKLSVAYSPIDAVTFKVTGAQKGRVPTLRERFRLDIGNTALGPEKVRSLEVAATMEPSRWVEFEVASWLRDTNGLIRFDGDFTMLVNTGDLLLRGVDAKITVAKDAIVGGGASWTYTDAYSEETGLDPLDFLPAHRGSVWLDVNPHRRVGATARLRHVGERVDRRDTLPGYEVFDLSAFARLPRGLFASVRIDNLSNERYDVRHNIFAPGRIFTFLLQGRWE